MAEGDCGSVIANLEFDNVECQWPVIAHVAGNVYVIAYEGPDDDGWLKTVTISDAGAMAMVGGGSLEFDTGGCAGVVIIHVTGNVWAVCYMNAASYGVVKTLTISDAGAMALVGGGSLDFETTMCVEPNIIHVAGNVYAIAYRGPDADGWLKTITISDGGIPALVSGGSLEFDGVWGMDPHIIHVAGNVYAIAYRGPDEDGWIKTVTISDAGTMALVGGGSLEFDGVKGHYPNIIHVAGNVYAIAYRGPDDDGWIKTVTISDAGAMALVGGGSLEFDNASGQWPDIVHVSGNVYAIIYSYGTQAWVKTVTITDAGAISFADSTGLQISATIGNSPEGIHIAGDVYAAVYGGPDVDGWISTFSIETIISAKIDMLMMMGIG